MCHGVIKNDEEESDKLSYGLEDGGGIQEELLLLLLLLLSRFSRVRLCATP